uniref:V-type proton ATPase subunit D n=1 Tax=Heterorhabditis bacteriophora TaxID=37862 RepID=A0A1I7X037_HETBA
MLGAQALRTKQTDVVQQSLTEILINLNASVGSRIRLECEKMYLKKSLKAEQKEKEKRQRERLRSLELQRDKLHKAACGHLYINKVSKKVDTDSLVGIEVTSERTLT